MDSVKICLIAVTCVSLLVIVRQWKSDFLPLLRLGVALLFAFLIISAAAPVVAYLRELTSLSGLSGYAELLLKALGIAVLTQCCAGLCRECGENVAAGGVELAGKVEILLLCLPLIGEILSTAKELLTWTG